jgi:hypothetical protein
MIYLQTNCDGSKSLGAINSGKNEGIGAILQSQLLLYAICKKFKLSFYNTGFRNIGHSSYSNYSQEEWDNLFTNFFNISSNRLIFDEIYFSEIDDKFFSYISNNKEKNVIINLESEEVLRYGQSIINEIYEKQYLKSLKNNFLFDKNYFSKSVLNICLHIRAINLEDISYCVEQNFRECYTDKEENRYINLLENLKEVCYNEKINLHIYSQGSIHKFLNILNLSENNFKIFLHLDENPVSDIYHMSHADLLIMSNSSYSWVSHLLNYNVTLVRDNFWHSLYPNILNIDKNYRFDVGKLKIR